MPDCWDGHDNATRVRETGHGSKLARYLWSDDDLGGAIAGFPAVIDEPIRRFVRALAETPAFRRSRDEILLTATAQNLRKLATFVTRPPPTLNPA